MSEKTAATAHKIVSKTGLYSFTVNPDDTKQYEGRSDRLLKFAISMIERLYRVREYANFEAYIEVSKGGRLHIHGTFYDVSDLLEFFMRVPFILGEHASYELDKVNDPDVWEGYITKDQQDLNIREHLPEAIPYPLLRDDIVAYHNEFIDPPVNYVERVEAVGQLRCYDKVTRRRRRR